jgi:surfactin synthase thioesterase subunit
MHALAPADEAAPWIIRAKATGDEQVRLICLPYAGGSASTFRRWPARLPGVEILAVQTPGRETRLAEPPFHRIEPIVAGLADALRGELDGRYAIFGHSLGARTGFELARELRRRGERPPEALFISACKAPHIPRPPLPTFGSMPEKVFLARLRRMNGTPPEVLDNPEMLELFLPAIRADFAVVDSYEYADEPALDCPLRVFGGRFDSEAREDELLAWQAHTTTSFALTMLDGGHFVITTHEHEMVAAIAQTLSV